MKLRFALIGEGNTERHLVEHIKALCSREGIQAVEGVWATDLLARSGAGKDVSSQISALLENDPEFDLLFIHRDSDNVPVEARRRAIRAVVGNPQGKVDLELPKLPQVELRSRPKELLKQALALAAKPGRRHVVDDRAFSRYRRELLENLDIDGPINQLSSWQNLLRDLRAALTELPPAR